MIEEQSFEQMIVLYETIKNGCMIGTLLFLSVAVILFFKLKIPDVFGALTGRSAKKAIRRMAAAESPGSGIDSEPKAISNKETDRFVLLRSIEIVHTDETLDTAEQKEVGKENGKE